MKRSNEPLKIIGVTGGIAAGKSVVAELLRQNGGFVLDADKLSHDIMMKGNVAYNEITDAISGDYLRENGEIDRKKLGAIVFSDSPSKSKLKTLETIVHKHVIAKIHEEIRRLNGCDGNCRFIVIDAPLLIESGLSDICDFVWIVHAGRNIRAERIVERNSLTLDAAFNRIDVQTNWEKLINSDLPNKYIIIENDGGVCDLRECTEKHLKNLSESLYDQKT